MPSAASADPSRSGCSKQNQSSPATREANTTALGSTSAPTRVREAQQHRLPGLARTAHGTLGACLQRLGVDGEPAAGCELRDPHAMKVTKPAVSAAEAALPALAAAAEVGLHRAQGAAVLGEAGGFGGVDRERDLAEGDAGDLGGVDEAAARLGLRSTMPSKMCSRALSRTLATVPIGDAVAGDDRDAAGEGLVADLVVVVVDPVTSSKLAGPRRCSVGTAGAAPDVDDLAHRGGAPGDPRVQRAQDELEAAALELLELADQRVEAAALLVDRARCRPGPMPFDVVRRVDGAVASTASRVVCAASAIAARTLCGGSDGLPDAAVQVDVALAVGAHADDRRVVGGDRAAAARRGRRPRRRRARSRRRTARRRGRSRARAASRCARTNSSPWLAAGRKWKMPPPSLSISTITSFRPRRDAAISPPMSCASATSPISSTVSPRTGRGHAERGRDRPVDPVRAAVGEHAERRLAGREERLDVADRHRGGDDERRLGRQQRAELGRHARLVQPRRPDHLGDRPRGGPVGRRASRRARRCPCACAAACPRAPRASRAGRRRRSCATTPAGSCQADSGSNATCSASSPASHVPQRLGGRQVADAQDEVRRVRGRPLGIAQQRVVVRDRGRPAAGAGDRLGQQRRARALGERGERRGQARVALRPAGDDDQLRAASAARPRGLPAAGRTPSRSEQRARDPRPAALAAGRELDVRHPVARRARAARAARSSGAPARAARRSRCRTRGRRAGAASARAPATPGGRRPRSTTWRRCRRA